uniref:acetyl-CoA carboxylase beta subunit n=1 Tax=Nothotsuga longibracteata TaxID=123601 RepID=UPI000D218A2E|nr:acetyl-CoA carboxylase beta subunit [Nothotsuga longibracteata]
MDVKEWFEENRRINSLLRDKDVNEPEKKIYDREKIKALWTQCDNCTTMLYVQFLKEDKSICKECGHYLKMNSSDRIELLIDHGTWCPMDENMYAIDVLSEEDEDSHSDSNPDLDQEEPYKDHIISSQIETGLPDAIQTGIGKLNGIPIALGVMDFKFMGGSMGSVVGEKITRLIEYATENSLPVIMVCASGGARMQEGSFSSMQMAKIASALYIHQKEKKLLYISILTSPTTGGVTASFGMLGDIIIAEPKAYIAFAGKRVIEQTLGQVIEDFQVTENLFDHGLFDLVVSRDILKGVLSDPFWFYGLYK